MQDILTAIEAAGIFPVVEIDRLEDAVPVAKALFDGGIAALEITLRTPCAYDAISAVRQAFPQVLVGAGTVLTPDQVDQARNAGAGYMVAPGFNPRVVRHCLDKDIPVIPGIDSPSGIELAIEAGLSVLKFFPAEFSGGVKGLESMAGPFKDRIRFLPLGGITPQNLTDYACCEKVMAVGGTWIAKRDLIRAKSFSRITRNAREALALLHGLEFTGIRLKQGCATEDANLMERLSQTFTLPCDGFTALALAGDDTTAANGRISVGCNNLRRTAIWLKSQGIEARFRPLETAPGNGMELVLARHLGGFEIQLIEKVRS